MTAPFIPNVERTLLELIADGEEYTDIARRGHMHVSTVKRHATLLRARLGARTNAQAVHIAHQRGLLGPSTAPSTPVEARHG